MTQPTSKSGASLDLDLIEELETQTAEQIRHKRTYRRVNVQTKCTLRSVNVSDPVPIDLSGVTCDISDGGCRVVFARPVMVGDCFRLDFSDPGLKWPTMYARCVRARLINESAYELAFSFINSTPSAARAPQKSGLDLF